MKLEKQDKESKSK